MTRCAQSSAIQRNPALSLRPIFLPISPSRCFAPGDAFGISAEPSCQVTCRLERMSSADVLRIWMRKVEMRSNASWSNRHSILQCFLWVKSGQISFGSFLVLPLFGYPQFDPYRQRFSEQSGLFIFICCSIHEEIMI